MFAEKFNALMNIAEISNSRLGRKVNINSSHIGRLRSGVRPLPRKHEYLPAMCLYIAAHIEKEYQINALQKLTGIGNATLDSSESTALFLEQWLLADETDNSVAAKRFISDFSHIQFRNSQTNAEELNMDVCLNNETYLYGNSGKRKAVEQFLYTILQTEKPQTLLLFSDENMSWLYEDDEFAKLWAQLFTKVIMRGNRVKIIHTVSRNMTEMLEAVMKWAPIYMTGMIEPYYYPRFRDGIFQRTVFLAPESCAVVSSSVQQNTDGMLNLFLTDKSAIDALSKEYEDYFSLCRPLMYIYTSQNSGLYENAALSLSQINENSYLCSAMPPLFTMPEKIIREITEQSGNEMLLPKWKQSKTVFFDNIKNQHITLILEEPESAMLKTDKFLPATGVFNREFTVLYTKEQYIEHINFIKQLEKQCDNLELCFVDNIVDNTLLYVKEHTGVVMYKTDAPKTAFVINEKNMVNAFTDYIEKCILNS